jgi:hypothetical protein
MTAVIHPTAGAELALTTADQARCGRYGRKEALRMP